VIVVGDATQVPGEVHGPPFGARRRREPGCVAELSGQLADHGDPVAVAGQDPRAGYPAHLRLGRLVLLLLRCTVPSLPATRQPVREASGAASVPELRAANKPYA